MASVINTNIPSLNAQRNLTTSQGALNVSIQRLSTGLRVNSAKDDAAGLAIAERMNAQVKGLNVAARNANDGVSLAQTAEGALGKIGDMVQRMRELAVQSSNATNNSTDRSALNEEVKQLQSEIQRLATTTNFNGTKLLDGSFSDMAFQVGADAGQSINIASIADANTDTIGKVYSGTVTLDTNTTDGLGLSTAAAVAITVTVDGLNLSAATPPVAQAASFTLPAASSDMTMSERINQLVEDINTSDKFAGKVTATYDSSSQQILIMSSEGTMTLTSDNTGDAAVSAADDKGTAIDKMDIGSFAGAQKAIMQADEALKTINSARAQLGAVQSRFESAVSNIQIQSENISAARSRIMDADFAAETASMTRAQILQQAGTAMLSQANQLPQQVLSLLR